MGCSVPTSKRAQELRLRDTKLRAIALSPGAETHATKMFFESTTNLENQKQNRKINPQEQTTMTWPHPFHFSPKHASYQMNTISWRALFLIQESWLQPKQINGKSLVFGKTGASNTVCLLRKWHSATKSSQMKTVSSEQMNRCLQELRSHSERSDPVWTGASTLNTLLMLHSHCSSIYL